MMFLKLALISYLFLTSSIGYSGHPLKVLVVLSSSNFVTLKEGGKHPTGYFLSELAQPVIALQRAGYQVLYANTKGNKATVDPICINPGLNPEQWFSGATEKEKLEKYSEAILLIANRGFLDPAQMDQKCSLDAPCPLSSFLEDENELDTFSGIFVPGGHAPIEDLKDNKDLKKILQHFHAHLKPTALICHGPVALLSTREFGGERHSWQWPYEGYKMTAFSTVEEKEMEELGTFGDEKEGTKIKHLKFYLQDKLEVAGGLVQVGTNWSSNSMRDRELITGQNPQSEEAFTALFLEALTERRLSFKTIERWNDRAELKPGFLYTMNTKTNWHMGYTTLFIGERKDSVSGADFISRLTKHVVAVKDAFRPMGLKGYLFYATQEYEIAYQNWESQTAASDAFASKAAKLIFEDAQTFFELKPVLFNKIERIPDWLVK